LKIFKESINLEFADEINTFSSLKDIANYIAIFALDYYNVT
jgi:hypothetical protein